MSSRFSYPSDEVARHAAVEAARTCSAVIVLGTTDDEGAPALRFVRCGELPEGIGGDFLATLAQVIDAYFGLEELE